MGRKKHRYTLTNKGYAFLRHSFGNPYPFEWDDKNPPHVPRPYPLKSDELDKLAIYLESQDHLPEELRYLPVRMRAHAEHLRWMQEEVIDV